MQVTKTFIDGLLVIQPTIFQDARGYFYEPYNRKAFAEIGIGEEFVQDNQSFSQNGVVRGLHFQKSAPCPGKTIKGFAGGPMGRCGRYKKIITNIWQVFWD